MNYIEITLTVTPSDPWTEVLMAQLAEIGFESFIEEEQGLKAYIPENEFNESRYRSLEIWDVPNVSIDAERRMIPHQNWNARWEADFKPVDIDESCTIRAPFHEESNKPFDIVIAPNMSFGTGHHETTQLMLQMLLAEDVNGRRVLDMGCGTGVIAILAEKKGASSVTAVDIDPVCEENALENAALNNCSVIATLQGGGPALKTLPRFDVVFANINRNVLLGDIPLYREKLNDGGTLFLSGFYTEDLSAITEACACVGLQFEKKLVKNNWVSAKYVF